jgi:hypothetical protein
VNLSPETIKQEAKGEAGRKSKYSIKKVREICNHVLRGIPLRYASPLCGIPFGTAKGWLAEHPEMGEMLEEAHGKFVQNHVGNIERHSKMSEKPSQWLLERRAKQEFAPAYTDQGKSGSTLNVLALGGDALSKLMQGWSGMIGGEMKQAEIVDVSPVIEQNTNTEPSPSLLVEDITISKTSPPTENPSQVSEVIVPKEEKQALPVEEVKVKRGRGRPRKYPKPDGGGTPPTLPTPLI